MSKPEDTTIIIDAGHGGKDSGAVGTLNTKEVAEKDFNLELSIYQNYILDYLGYDVKMTRKDDVYLEPEKRAKIVRQSGADYCISNHFNAFEEGEAEGAEIIHSIHQTGVLAGEIKRGLEDIGRNVRRRFCKSDGKDEPSDYYFMHRETGKVRTIIMENAFIDNQEDFKTYLRRWKKLGCKVAKSLHSFIRRN